MALEDIEIDRVLYLAVPLDIYDTLFTEPLTLKAITRYNIKIIVYNIEEETIEKWIK